MTAPVAAMRARAARSARRQRASRSALPVHLPGAAEFSDEPDLQSVHWLLSTLKGMAWLWRDLRNATRIDKQWGRRRGAGDWSLLYLAYLVSGFVDIEPWY